MFSQLERVTVIDSKLNSCCWGSTSFEGTMAVVVVVVVELSATELAG